MGVVKTLALAGAAAMMSTATLAADLPPPILQPPPVFAPPPPDTSGWYLRGDVGVGSQSFKNFAHHQTNAGFVWPASWTIDMKDVGDAAFVGFGVGYAWNNWLRMDVTSEYRASAKFKVQGSYTEFCTGGGRCFDVYDGSHQAWLVMANAYIDLGTWWCVTPFVGAGFGGAYSKVKSLNDVGYIADGSVGYGYSATDSANWTFAWALHAGLAYNVTNNFKVEFAYRYLNMGDIDTPIINCNSGGCASAGARAFYSMTNFTSQDFKIGFRWMLTPETPPPLYTPPPPLMRRG